MSQSKDYQIVFDELIQFVLETISSENYLKEQGIHRQKIQKQTFKNRLNSQKSKNQRTKIKQVYMLYLLLVEVVVFIFME